MSRFCLIAMSSRSFLVELEFYDLGSVNDYEVTGTASPGALCSAEPRL